MQDWFEICLDRYPDLPSVAVIRSVELKCFPREFLEPPVLDLCCGDGFFTHCLGIQGVFGCDIDPVAIERARSFPGTYAMAAQCDARDLRAFDDNAFKTVFSNCALEHVHGIDRALASIGRVLQPGGRLVISAPGQNLNNWFSPKLIFAKIGLSQYGERLNSEYNRKQDHVNICSAESWTRKLESAGFRMENVFSLFSEKEYRLITFFESFVVDSFPGPALRRIYRFFKRTVPIETRKQLWRKLFKPIYLNADRLETGAELLMIARKP